MDPVAAAKVCVEFANKNDKLTIVVGGALGEKSSRRQRYVKALAKLPSLDELRGKIIGVICRRRPPRWPGVIQAPAGQLARVIGAYGSQG